MGTIRATNISHRVWQLTFAVSILAAVGWSACGSDTPREYKDLFYLPQEQQEERFKEFPLEKQVDVYTYAMYVEPPLTRYATYLARNGKSVLPFLLTRLEAEKSDTAKAHLVYAFKETHERSYSLRNEKEIVGSLKRVVGNMTDQYRKKECEQYLKAIEESPGFLSRL